jgi:hypothetical protein
MKRICSQHLSISTGQSLDGQQFAGGAKRSKLDSTKIQFFYRWKEAMEVKENAHPSLEN